MPVTGAYPTGKETEGREISHVQVRQDMIWFVPYPDLVTARGSLEEDGSLQGSTHSRATWAELPHILRLYSFLLGL